MAKKILRKFLPHPDVIMHNRWIKLLGPRLQEPSLWHINRRSCSLAVALGVFCAFIPVPFQMVIAAIGAILFRVNILIAVPTVWISNPVTMGPLYFFCYLVGAEILQIEPAGFDFELSFDWLLSELILIWQPFLLGCLIVGLVLSLASFLLVRVLWHLHILNHIKIRAARLHNRQRFKRRED
jgi:uncharacterized protein (DUF2062 family)